MLVLFEKMAMLLTLLIFGYFFARRGIVSPDFTKGLSKLVMNFFLVAMILSSVMNKEIDMTGSEIVTGVLMMGLLFVVSIGLGLLTAHILGGKNGDKGMYTMLITFMNNGFVGFPIIAAVYGDGAVFFASLSNIPFNILLYTFGVWILQRGRGQAKFDIKSVLSAPLIATLIAIVIFAFNIQMPTFIYDLTETIAAATVPLSMMCVGLSLGGVSLKEAVMQPKLYGVAFVRLVACPLVVWLLLRSFVANPVILGTLVIMAAMPSAIVCTILGIEYGRDGVESSEGVLISTLLAMITVPLLITVLGL